MVIDFNLRFTEKAMLKTQTENDEVLLAGFGRKGKAKGDIVSTWQYFLHAFSLTYAARCTLQGCQSFGKSSIRN